MVHTSSKQKRCVTRGKLYFSFSVSIYLLSMSEKESVALWHSNNNRRETLKCRPSRPFVPLLATGFVCGAVLKRANQ